MTAQAQVRGTLAITAVVAIWFVVLVIVPRQHPIVAAAGAFDLTGTAGAAMYFVAVRRGHLPRWVLTLTIAMGAIGGRLLLRSSGAIAAVGALELVALALLVVRIRRARRAWREALADHETRADALERALAATGMPPAMRHVLTTELSVMANVIAGWRKPRHDASVFTSHRTNGWSLIAGTFIGLTLLETPLVHVVLTRFDHATIAWVATCASLYSVAWLIGDLHALRHGGIVVTPSVLELRLGVRWRGQVPRADIIAVTRCNGAPRKQVDFSILGANVLVTLRRPTVIQGLFGRRRQVDVLALSIDELDRFERALEQPDASVRV